MTQKTNTLDSIFESFELVTSDVLTEQQRQAITTWVPEDYKLRFDQLQAKTHKRFGKMVKRVIMSCIEKAEMDIKKA